MKKFYLLIMVLAGFSVEKLIAQTASITNPNSSASIASGGNVSFTGSRSSGYSGSGSYTYSWASSPSSGVSFSPSSSSTSSSSSSTSGTFTNPGSYSVTVTVNRGSSSATSSATMVYVNPASSITASASPSSITLPTSSVTLNSSFIANGNTIANYAWTESSSDPVPATIASPNASSTNVSFTVAGTYTFTVTAGYMCQYGSATNNVSANVVVTVNSGSTTTYPTNLFALSSSGTAFTGFAIGTDSAHSGMVINGMNSLSSISAATTSAALGEDIAGYFYFMPNVTNTGNVTLYAMKHDGSSQTSVATIDINGSNDNSNLGFVRLGIDPSGYGWILASNNSSTLYLARFVAAQLNSTAITVINSNVGVQGGGSAATFGSGDLAFDKRGIMYALANDANNNTYIYTMDPSLNINYVTRKWTLVDPNGNNFTGSVNGCAFDSAGSMYISTSNGLYFIDATTINTAGAGTVKTRLAYNGSGFTDLATNIFPPKTTLPITLASFSVTKQGNNALVQWSTETEVNSNYVDVERSTNATDFEKVGSVSASGNTNTLQNYQFTDPLNGLSGVVYYRLKEVDIDGNINYSKIVALRLDGSSMSANFSVYPNPFASGIKVTVTNDKNEDATIHLFNISGQKIMSIPVTLQQGQNILPLSNLTNLQSGVYILQLVTNSSTVSQKIIKH
ncbi:MAG TPA: T9SS type A sorting domain-containing protein [Puia sp.]|nr:T9SS type A sorting domain-containing protein [Puia sp.]